MQMTLWFDGGCWPNPGGVGTFGWWIDVAGNEVAHGCGEACRGDEATNNVAEWVSLIDGLEWIARQNSRPSLLTIYGDSQLVIGALVEIRKCKASNLIPLRARAWELLDDIGAEWEAWWQPRGENDRADELTNIARDQIAEREVMALLESV